MVAVAPMSFGIGSICLAALSEVGFWSIFRQHRGNRFIQSAMITFMVLLSMVFWGNLKVPDWLFLTWIASVFLLAITTLFFFVQRGIHALRRRKADAQ